MSEPARVLTGELDGRRAVTLIGGGALQATFLVELGMVGSSLRHDGEELLGTRGGPDAYAERQSTFGIPLLYPWANRLSAWDYELGGRRVELERSPLLKSDAATGLPIHGAMAACRQWRLVADGGGSDPAVARAEAVLDYGADPELLEVFPFPHRLRYTIELDAQTLTVSLTVTPSSSTPVPIAFGFHPYIALPGSDRRDWEIELPVRRRAILDDRGIPNGRHQDLPAGELSGRLGGRTFDDSFDLLYGEPPRFAVADSRRRVEVRYSEGFPVAQVYAPEDSQLIAIEPMTAPIDALRSGDRLRLVEPGGSFSAAFAIHVEI